MDGTDHTAPHNVTWDSGSSHSLNVPSPQNVSGVNSRYVFSSWGHGGSQSQSVAPTSNTTYTANFTQQHSYDGATRSFNPERVAPGGSVTVTIQVGQAFSITETLPDGFTYTGSSIDDPADDNDVLTVGQTVTFTPFGERSFTYTVTASSTEGSHAFSGVARFDSDRDNDLPVGGASTVTVGAVIDEATLVARYDANNNGIIEKGEVIAAINDYLFGEGDEAISKAEVIGLINLYLFAPSTPHNRPGAPEGLTAAGNGQTRMDLSWSAPPSDGGAAITGYRIEVSENGSTWNGLVADTRNAATSYSHTGLTAGSTRHYRVSAINSAGTGPPSNIATGTTAGDAATDRAALAALYNATDGANWRNNGNWLSNAPMGEWHGVTTDSDGRVTQLILGNNQLTGEIPSELGSLTYLTELYLDNNQLTGEIPSELGNLTYLKDLDLSNNQLTGEIPSALADLSNLEVLLLSGNQLTGCIPASLGDVAINYLAELGLSYCSGDQAPDLVASVTSVGDAGLLYVGESFTINAEVYNQGTGPAASTTLRYYRSTDSTISTSDARIGTDPVRSLEVSGSSTESISRTAPSSAGTYYYGVCVDSVAGESNTRNNCSGGYRTPVREPAFVSTIECRATLLGLRYTIEGTVFAITALSNVTVIGYGIDNFGQRTKVGEDDLGTMSAQTSESFSISGINRLYTSCEYSLEWEY